MEFYHINNNRINFLVALHLVALFSLIFPYGFPVFSVVTLLYFCYVLINKDIFIKINYFTMLLYLVTLVYIIGVSNSEGVLYSYTRSDLLNIILIFLIILSTGKYSLIEYRKVIHRTLIAFAYITPVLTLVSLYKYYLLLNGVKIEYFEIPGRPYPWGTSLMPDYNMFALGMLIGLVSLSYLIKVSKNSLVQLTGILFGLMVFTTIIFSGSRRGWIVLIFTGVFFLYSVFKVLKMNTIKKNATFIVVAILFCILLLSGFKDNITITITDQYELEKIEYRYSTLDNIGESLYSRTARLDYTLFLASEFKIYEMIIGNGFSYLALFGEKFSKPGAEDYPHNPILSSLLYSGMLGVLLTTTLILVPFIRVIYNRKIFNLEYCFIYLIVLLFLMQSANSIFSINILWLMIVHFCLIPIKGKRERVHNESSFNGVKLLYK